MFRHKVPAIKVLVTGFWTCLWNRPERELWFSEGCAVLANWPTRSTPA